MFGALALLSFNPINQQDPGFLLKTGEYILTHHSVPTTDVFSFTAYGAQWIVHYWLAAVIFQLLYTWGGAAAVTSFVSLIALITFIFIFAAARQRTKNFVLPFTFTVVSFSLIYQFWVVRAQIFSYLFTAILLYLLERAWAKDSYRPLWVLPLIFVVWANVHAGVVFGIAILWLFVVAFMWRRHGFARPDKLSLKIALIALISSAAVFINPNGYIIYIFNFMIAPTTAALGNIEWMSLLSFSNWRWKLFFAAMVVVTALALYRAVYKYRRDHKIDLFHLGLIIATFILPIISVRHMIFFAIVVPIVLGAELEEFIEERGIDLSKYLRVNYIWLTFAAFLFVFGAWGVVETVKGGLIDTKELPVKAVDFIQAEGLKGPLFDNEKGSYLVWRLWSEKSGGVVFRDARDDVYRGKPIEEFFDVTGGRPGWQELVNNKYKINYFILWYPPPLFELGRNITARVTEELGFKLVYWDDNTIILVRDAPQNKKIIDQFAYNYVSPFNDPAKIPAADLGKAEAEILKALRGDPNSPELQDYFIELEKRLNPAN